VPEAARTGYPPWSDRPLPSDQRLRIALLGYRSNPFSGGQGVYLRYLSRALGQLGHEVDVISGEPYPRLDDDVRLIELPGLNLYATDNPLTALRPRHLRSATDLMEWMSMVSGGFPEPYTFGRRVASHLLKHRRDYDVIHDNQSLSYGMLELQNAGIPLVTTIHHPITHDLRIALDHAETWTARLMIRRWHGFLRMQTRVARRLQHIVTVSEQSKRDIAAAFDVPLANVSVIHNGVDTDEFRPLPDIPRSANRLITTASADQPLKGTQHLIPAFAILRESFPDLTLTFIGKPKPGGATERLIQRSGLAPWIEFKHGSGAEEIVAAYAHATIAVVPSEYEGFGLPAAEAMACAVPVVSTDGGALPEVVGQAGIIVPKGNPLALAGAIAELLRDKAARARLGQAGRERMLAQFSWQRAALDLTRYYHALMSR
jgi:glycosyltransferase involved in cell wall biosynthesis